MTARLQTPAMKVDPWMEMPISKADSKKLGLAEKSEQKSHPSQIARVVADVAAARMPSDMDLATVGVLIEETLRRMHVAVRAAAEAVFDRVLADHQAKSYTLSIDAGADAKEEATKGEETRKEPPADSRLLTRESAAALLGKSVSTIDRMVKRGALKPNKIDGSRSPYFLREDIERALGIEATGPESDESVPASTRKLWNDFNRE